MTENHRKFDEYYVLFKEELRNYIGKITYGNPGLAEDIEQETWTAAFECMDDLCEKTNENIIAWLKTVSRNRYLDEREKAYRKREIPASQIVREDDGYESDFSDGTRMTEEELAARSLLRLNPAMMEDEILTRLMFEEAVAGLSDEERKLVLCRLCAVPLRDAFPEEDCTDNALNIRCTRAIKKLRGFLEEKR